MRTKVVFVALLLAIGVLSPSALPAGGAPENDDRRNISELDLSEISPVSLTKGEKLNVLATTSIVGDVVSNVGGEAIELSVLIGVGQDPHAFEPTPSALAAIEDAHIIFTNGFQLEEGLLDTIGSAAKGFVFAVSTGIEPLATDHDERGAVDDGHDYISADPHVWFDPTNVMVWVNNIERVLSSADPENRDGYHERAAMYDTRLVNLDAKFRDDFASIPSEKRKLITDHHVLGYFAEEYGFEVIGAILPSSTTSADTSARSLAGLVEIIKREGVTTVFVGSTAGRGTEKLAESIARELGNTVLLVEILTGSLTVSKEPGDTYLRYMEYNADQILLGLAGE